VSYVDGFVIPVPNEKKEAFRKMAVDMAPIFLKHGALHIMECWGDDVPEGKVTSFPMAVKVTEDETVVFSWIVWPSKEVRDAGMAKVMEDPAAGPPDDMPFDGKRMIFGGFVPIVDTNAG
jgi:uncharacterized protein YbaA (DUF1428 family)